MKRAVLSLLVFAFVLLAIILVANSARHYDQSAQPEDTKETSSSGRSAKHATADKSTDPCTDTAPADEADAQPAEQWTLKLTLKWKKEFEAECLASPGDLLTGVRVTPPSAEADEDDDLDVYFDCMDLKERGPTLVLQDSLEPIALAAFRAAKTLNVECIFFHVGEEWNLYANKVATPTIVGTVIDLGTIEVAYTEALHDDQWLITGRLLDCNGRPLTNNEKMTLHGEVDETTEIEVYVSTDSKGWFATIMSEPSKSELTDEGFVDGRVENFDPLSVSWTLDADRNADEEHNLFRLPAPKVERGARIINFGEVTLPSSSLEVLAFVPEDADPVPELRETAAVVLGIPDDDYFFHGYFKTGVPVRFLLPAGTYKLTVEFHEEGAPWQANYIRSPDRVSCAHVSTVVLHHNSSESVRVTWEPPHVVAVTVQAPASVGGVLEVTYSRWWSPDDVVSRPLTGGPISVRLLSYEKAVARAKVAGYAPVEAEVPADSDSLVLFPAASDDTGCIIVEYCPDPITHRVIVRVVRLEGDEITDIEINSTMPVTEARTVKAGKYRVRCLAHPWQAPPDGDFAPPQEIELAAGETRRVRFDKFGTLPADEWRVVCAGKKVEGSVPGASLDKPGWPQVPISDELMYVRDKHVLYRWKIVEDGDRKISEIDLPARIEVRFGNGIVSSDEEQVAEVQVVVSFKGGYVRVESGTQNTSAWLWALPGEATIRLQQWNVLQAGPVWQRAIQVPADGIVVVEVDDDLCRVNYRNILDKREKPGHMTPDWGLWDDQGEFLRWLDRDSELISAGTYVAKPGFGPDSGREIRFTAAPNKATDVPLWKLAPIPSNGCIRIARPHSVASIDVEDANFQPAELDPEKSGWEWTTYTFTAEHMELRGLLVGVPIRVEVFIADGERGHHCIFTVTLNDANPVNVDVTWKLEEGEGD